MSDQIRLYRADGATCIAGPHQIEQLLGEGWTTEAPEPKDPPKDPPKDGEKTKAEDAPPVDDQPPAEAIPLDQVPGMRADWIPQFQANGAPDVAALAALEPQQVDDLPISGIGAATAASLVKAARGVLATRTI